MEGHVTDEITRLAAACDRRRRSEVLQEFMTTRLAVSATDRRRRFQQTTRVYGGWSKLPMDILFQVMSRLPSVRDRLHLAAVCRQWHAAEQLHLPYSLPELCLAVPNGGFFAFRPDASAILMHRGDDLSLCSYRGASSSQLLCDAADQGAYSLVNPFTLKKRALPVPSGVRVREVGDPAPEEGYVSEEMPVRKLVACPDGLVAAIVGHERVARVALCKPEAAWSWSLNAGDPWRWYADMAFFDGKLYALTNDQDLLALEVAYDDDESGRPRISSVERVIDGAGCHYVLQEYTRMRYLVVRPCGRGLLMVCRIMLEYGSATYEFAVFQADLEASQWVQVDTLGGDEALFVGRLCSRALLADRHGVRGGKIFFLDDSAGMEGPRLPSGEGTANVYDMKDGRVSVLLPTMRSYRGGEVPATWLFDEHVNAEGVSPHDMSNIVVMI